MTSLYLEIFDAMQSDDESHERISDRLVAQWERSTPQEKAIIDNVLITLCGWSFETLQKTANQINSEAE